MVMSKVCLSSCLGLLMISMFIGCSKPQPELPPTYAVTGQVVYSDGQPMPGGFVEFISLANPSTSMQAYVEPDGKFTLRSIVGNTSVAGGLEGDCKVQVTLPIEPNKSPPTIVLKKPYKIETAAPNHFEIKLDIKRPGT